MNYHKALMFARENRRRQTYAETVFWLKVRNRSLNDLKFVRQKVIGFKKFLKREQFFILDYYCHQHKLAIEIDGGYHRVLKNEDARRDEILKSMGINTLRFTNEMVIKDWTGVPKQILSECC